ncbi:amidohydrolase family protein [Pseudomonas typographi]|uniref:amidohydrolase family protein n=1 Tax=Pseudomonas typographi TaxID=2715964 RepID=UPI001683D680|nr:amidohydrolase family protein [Pseudomonas typographi]MBD1554875.1 amidohydrolase family protein [Pseudomonas typographi]MBD1589916.1 amidohydrolase family protein [Pseudomonas typographi]
MTIQISHDVTGVDGHAHVFDRSLALTEGRRYTPAYDATLAQWLGHLDAHGLSHGVLVQPSFLGSDNSYLLAALAKAPRRLRGVAVVEPGIAPAALERLRTQGVVGIRLNLMGKPLPDLTAPSWQPLLGTAAELGLHVELHRQVEDIPTLCTALRARGCKVVIDHFGRPHAAFGVGHPTFRRLLEWGGDGQVWVKVSAIYRLGGTLEENLSFARQALPLLLEHFGPERLVWGSDWPHTQHEHQVGYASQFQWLQSIAPQPQQRQALLVAGARALFGL